MITLLDKDILLKALTNKDKRIKVMYNVDVDLKKEIEKEAKNQGINSSDMLNYILIERYKGGC